MAAGRFVGCIGARRAVRQGRQFFALLHHDQLVLSQRNEQRAQQVVQQDGNPRSARGKQLDAALFDSVRTS